MSCNVFNKIQLEEIKNKIINIFGEDIIETAFITGSIAAGNFREDSDIDIFVCVSNSNNLLSKKNEFENYYNELHKKFNRIPDNISPGEIVLFSTLKESIKKIENLNSSYIVFERGNFDAICWVGMLLSKSIILVPHSDKIINLKEMSKSIAYKWAKKLESSTVITENTGKLTDVDKILRRNISCPGYYDAH